jgi:hypothetical protein
VKAYMNKNNVSLKTALKESKNTYRNTLSTSSGRKRDVKGRFI